MPVSFSWSLAADPAGSSNSSSSTPGALAGADAGRDLALDPADGDLLVVDGDLVLVSGAEGIASDLKARLQTFAGEWGLDTSIGLPYFTEIAERPTDARLRDLFRSEILGTPGIVSLERLELQVSGRVLSLTFRALCDLGALIDAALTVDPGGS